MPTRHETTQQYLDRTRREQEARVKAQDAKDMKALALLKRLVKKVVPPAGVDAAWSTQAEADFTSRGEHWRVRRGDDIEVRFWLHGDGETRFRAQGTWRTFERRGIESSFYWIGWDGEIRDIGELVVEQIKRCEERIAYYSTALTIPEVGSTVQPDRLPQLKLTLKKECMLTFPPSGMGTGHIVHTKRPRQTWGVRRATQELEKFFGIEGLWITTFDAD